MKNLLPGVTSWLTKLLWVRVTFKSYRLSKDFKVAKYIKKQSRTMGKRTRAIHRYTVIIFVATIVNQAFVDWAAFDKYSIASNGNSHD